MMVDALDNAAAAAMGPEEAAVNTAIAALGEEYGSDAVVATVDPRKLLKLATLLYKYGVSSGSLLAGDSDEGDSGEEEEEEEEEESEEESEEEEEEKRIVNENAPPLDERRYQFGHEEEEELVTDDEADADDSDDADVSGFTPPGFEQYMVGNPFQNSLELLELVRKNDSSAGDKLFLSDVYDLTGNNCLELEDFEGAITAYETAIDLMKQHYGAEDALHEDITDAYLKLCEALKWAQDTTRHEKHLKTVIDMVEKRIDQRKSKDVEKDRELALTLKEDLDDLRDSHADIREKHPEFDSILKRALGQLLSPEEVAAASGSAVNDLSSMVKKKKPKHK
ncbi:hypothetical protein DAKH74_050440 [Maudiozyma humilis]|uniref:Tetratricopeptide SHNi-TPR domain-containing protein n=1 Tax=Maudiozyma humilis TaxID=51915 RepID=A0AAV5S476_MAUHU|nr:hypothetical protein DAKH74_050440 [Kazachstania humilis]